MPIIKTVLPKGLIPIKDNYKIPEEASTLCENIELRSGSLVSLPAISDVIPDRTLVEQISLTPNHTIVKGPINDDQFSRHYYSTHEPTDKMKVIVTKLINQASESTSCTVTDGNPANLYDGNDLTYLTFDTADSITYDFDLIPKDITSVMVSYTSAQYVNAVVSVEYSDNNIDWTEVKQLTLLNTSKDQTRPIFSSGVHQYWRLRAVSGSGRLVRFSMHDGTLSTASARDVFITAPSKPTLTSLSIDNSTTDASFCIGETQGILNKVEIEGAFIKAHFSIAFTATGALTVGIFGIYFPDVTSGQIYPKDKQYLTKSAVNVGTINLVSVSREIIGGLDYTNSSHNYVAIFEYQLFTSSTQERTAQYVIAYEDDLGQVGEPSLPVEFNAIDKGSIRIAELTFGPVLDPNALYTRVYRSSEDGQYYLSGKVPIGAIVFEDIYQESDYERLIQGEPLGNFGNPPEGLTNLCLVSGGIMAGTDHKKTVWLSDPLKPNVMTYSRTTSANIVGMASTGSELVVCTDGNPELITGSHPSVMSQDIIMTNQACVSRESITQVKNAILYAGTDGLVSVVGARGDVITKDILSSNQWLEYNPSSMIGVSLDGKYYGFNSTDRVFVFDLQTGELTNIDTSVIAAYSDISDDAIYVDTGDGARSLFGHPTQKRSKTFQSKFHRFPNPVTFNAMRVNAESYNDTVVTFYINGSAFCSIQPVDANSRRLPRMPQARELYYRVTGTDTVSSIEISTSMGELRES